MKIDKFVKAKAGLVLDQPFFASLLLNLKCIEDNNLPSYMGTDGENLWYNPQLVESLSLDEVKGVIVHEICHMVLEHHLREEKRDHVDWNISTDYPVNQMVENTKMKLPKNVLRDPKFGNMIGEEVYKIIHRDKPPQEGDGSGSGKGQGQNNSFKGMPKECIGEVSQPKGKNGKALTPNQLKQKKEENKIRVNQAAQAAKMMGNLPAEIEKLVDTLNEVKIPWRDVLARFIDEHSKNDYSWSMPNRRYIAQGLYLPQLDKAELGQIYIIFDTSGSIGDEEMTSMASEIRGITNTYDNAELYGLYVDSVLHGKEFKIENDTKLKPIGSGGTCYKPGFNYIVKEAITPKAIIYFTDGECDSFPKDIGIPTLWILTQKPHCFPWNPPFGETIIM